MHVCLKMRRVLANAHPRFEYRPARLGSTFARDSRLLAAHMRAIATSCHCCQYRKSKQTKLPQSHRRAPLPRTSMRAYFGPSSASSKFDRKFCKNAEHFAATTRTHVNVSDTKTSVLQYENGKRSSTFFLQVIRLPGRGAGHVASGSTSTTACEHVTRAAVHTAEGAAVECRVERVRSSCRHIRFPDRNISMTTRTECVFWCHRFPAKKDSSQTKLSFSANRMAPSGLLANQKDAS